LVPITSIPGTNSYPEFSEGRLPADIDAFGTDTGYETDALGRGGRR
jgi:hypothetical protein